LLVTASVEILKSGHGVVSVDELDRNTVVRGYLPEGLAVGVTRAELVKRFLKVKMALDKWVLGELRMGIRSQAGKYVSGS
jgi:hypothetical protein